MERLIFYYDSDCGMCSSFAAWAKANTNADLHSIQESEPELLRDGLAPAQLLLTAHARTKTGLLHGAPAVAALFSVASARPVRLLGAALGLPIVRNVAAFVYAVVAKQRS
jgi:predicted DCC family thiol-disulfide oxidoreductase YuxK